MRQVIAARLPICRRFRRGRHRDDGQRLPRQELRTGGVEIDAPLVSHINDVLKQVAIEEGRKAGWRRPRSKDPRDHRDVKRRPGPGCKSPERLRGTVGYSNAGRDRVAKAKRERDAAEAPQGQPPNRIRPRDRAVGRTSEQKCQVWSSGHTHLVPRVRLLRGAAECLWTGCVKSLQ